MSIFYLSLDEKINNFGGSATKIGHSLQNNLQLVNLTEHQSYDHPYSSEPQENINTQKALPELVFSFNNNRPVIKGFTRILNLGLIAKDIGTTGTSNTNITSGIHARSIHKNRLDTSTIRNNQYNFYTGKFEFESGSPGIYNDFFGTDMAAAVSRTNPGALTFKNSQVINRQYYKPKTT